MNMNLLAAVAPPSSYQDILPTPNPLHPTLCIPLYFSIYTVLSSSLGISTISTKNYYFDFLYVPLCLGPCFNLKLCLCPDLMSCQLLTSRVPNPITQQLTFLRLSLLFSALLDLFLFGLMNSLFLVLLFLKYSLMWCAPIEVGK